MVVGAAVAAPGFTIGPVAAETVSKAKERLAADLELLTAGQMEDSPIVPKHDRKRTAKCLAEALVVDIPEEDAAREPLPVAVHRAFFEGAEADLPYPVRRQSDEFDFGYALTVHKAQGSQWDDVVLFDESRAFREHRARWLYTGVTRAARRLTLVR